MCDWGSENLRQDVRWKFGMPPVNNANYGWIQLFHSTLNENGRAGFIMANSASDTRSSEQDRPVIKLANRPAERVRTLFTSPDERGLLEEAPNLYAKVGIK